MDGLEVAAGVLDEALECKMACRSCVADWHDLQPDNISLDPISGGITNRVYRAWRRPEATEHKDSPQAALVRVYGPGTGVFFDRTAELETFRTLGELGLGPRLLGSFSWGRVEEFIPARPMQNDEMRSPETSRAIAQALARIHVGQPVAVGPPVWVERLERWIALAGGILGGGTGSIRRTTEAKSLLQTVVRHSAWLHERLRRSQTGELTRAVDFCDEVVFCHNDLLGGNILVEDAAVGGASGRSPLHVIDFEYAGRNPRGFDLANHFSEHCGLDLDPAAYPSRALRRQFIRAYCEVDGAFSGPLSDSFVDAVVDRLVLYSMASDVFWGVWGIIQHVQSDIDFDFLWYAQGRIERMFEFNRAQLQREPAAVAAADDQNSSGPLSPALVQSH